MRLLVVDDAPDIATLLKLAFQLDGYPVDTALAGAPALELAAVNDYDVLILDLGLPDMDGMEVCRRLRAVQPQLLIIISTVPIVMLTNEIPKATGSKGWLPAPMRI